MEITAVQKFYRYFLKCEEGNIQRDDMFFDDCIKTEKEQMKSAFIAGIFARDFMSQPDFDINKYFDKFYYKKFD
jgi:hypothetical protein